jgi:hypothetical protein
MDIGSGLVGHTAAQVVVEQNKASGERLPEGIGFWVVPVSVLCGKLLLQFCHAPLKAEVFLLQVGIMSGDHQYFSSCCAMA